VEEVKPVGEVSNAVSRMYGQRGQAQYGIDVYARDPIRFGETLPQRRYICLQARRLEAVSKTALQAAVSDFVGKKWSTVARKFIYATSLSGVKTQFADEMETQAEKLARDSIDFVVWDQEEMSRLLRDKPQLVDDFFGRAWVTVFCGSTQAEKLGSRLDAYKVSTLRKKLARIYGAAFQIADSGQLALSRTTKPILLHDRFVTPDVVVTTHDEASESIISEDTKEIDRAYSLYDISSEDIVLSRNEFEADLHLAESAKRRQMLTSKLGFEKRLHAEMWLGTSMKQAIVGEPGAGKSSLLRYLVMDLLSDTPSWRLVAERWGGRLPIWLPFHYFTQRIAGITGQPASISAAIQAWLEQHDFGDVCPLVNEALADERLLLVVDGLDEWVSDEAGRTAAAALETFVEAHSVAVVVTTRPYGLTRLTLGANWNYARIAPLTSDQQKELAMIYFSITAGGDCTDASNSVKGLVSAFFRDIYSSPDLRAVSGIPLFMVLLIGLRLSSEGRLPERRFEVYDRAVQLLVTDHPQRRRVAAAVTIPKNGLSERDTRALIAKVAYLSQKRGDISTITEDAIRDDLVSALSSPDFLGVDIATARALANDILDVAEGELGLLVRKGTKEFGFLHRMIQEQLAAEHIVDHLGPEEVRDLLVNYVGQPLWREVLLAIVWRTKRPVELRQLVEVIETKVGATMSGLQARELLAEIVFGQYGLPADIINRLAPVLAECVETHSYGTHRLRLMDAIFSGLNNIATRSFVEKYLRRWALVTTRPTEELIWSVTQLPADVRLSTTIVRLLLLSLRKPDLSLVFGTATCIARRCGQGGRASIAERDALKSGLFELLADPPSGISQSAALAALALTWRDDPDVDYALKLARSHKDTNVRLVALADATGALLMLIGDEASSSVEPLQEFERRWLLSNTEDNNEFDLDINRKLLIDTVVQSVKGNENDLEYLLNRMEKKTDPRRDLIWEIALKAFPNETRVVESVCDLFRSDEHLIPLRAFMGRGEVLNVYAPPSPQNSKVAKAIEDHLMKFENRLGDIELFVLAAVDRGPIIKNALLAGLKKPHFVHWNAAALTQYFLHDEDVRVILGEQLMGNAIRASKIANAAVSVLNTDMVVQRLLDILRELKELPNSEGRVDFVISALIEACKARGLTSGEAGEAIGSQAIELLSGLVQQNSDLRDLEYDIDVAFYPTRAAKNSLESLASSKGHFVKPFLDAYREEPDLVAPFLDEALCNAGCLPAQMRIRLCQLLADRPASQTLVMAITKQWANEISERNKSYASMAYHHALITARNEGLVNENEWEAAKSILMREASCYGPYLEARRRAAWVGMSVIGDWSMIDGLVETRGVPVPLAVSLGESWKGPDIVLLQQISSHWSDLRSNFGKGLTDRLSGISSRNTLREIWADLSIVATQAPELERELEAAVEEDSELLKEESILTWFIFRPNRSPETMLKALCSTVINAENNLRGIADVLIAEPESVGIDRNDLRLWLESVVDIDPLKGGYGNRPLEALAAAFPGHDFVKTAWKTIKEVVDGFDVGRRNRLNPQTYLAVAYSAISSEEVLPQIRRDLAWLDRTGQTLFDSAITRHLSSRLRRDTEAVQIIAEAIMAPDTHDAEAAELASLLSVSVPLSKEILDNLEKRFLAQLETKLAPIIQDRVQSVSLSVRNLLIKDIETGNR
jgi:hypothetical protein